MKATERLREQHRMVEQLFDRLQVADESEREELAQEVVRNLVAHAMIERELFYPACMELVPAQIQQAQVEHDMLDFLLLKTLDAKVDDDGFDAKIGVLKDMVYRHVEEEESEILPAAQILGDIRLEQLGEEMEALFEELLEEDPRPILIKSIGIREPARRRRAAPRKTARRPSSKAPRKRATPRAGARTKASTRKRPLRSR